MILQVNEVPLCVDLDGTLTHTDTLFESVICAMKTKLIVLLYLPFWILRGRTYLKNRLGDYAVPNVELLPYNEAVLDFVRAEKEKGRTIVLATATISKIADAVDKHLRLFDAVYSSSRTLNLLSTNKQALLVKEFGEKGYDYVGDSSNDLAVWATARRAIVVSSNDSFIAKARETNPDVTVLPSVRKGFRPLVKQMRIYQWVKNLLLFLPILLAHRWGYVEGFVSVGLAFLSFGFAASFVYIVNDLVDLDSDRSHPNKRRRPLACGAFSIKRAFAVLPVLPVLSFAIAFAWLPIEFVFVLLAYLVITFLYSFKLKRIYIVDVIVLSMLYTVRILAGSLSSDVPVSSWMLQFSVFLFTSLAFVKRYTELRTAASLGNKSAKGRGYSTSDIEMIRSVGPISGYLAVLVFAFYLNSAEVARLYANTVTLWPVTLCLLFWITRIWFKAHRGEMTDDPIVFTIKDPASYAVFLIIIALLIGAVI